MGGRPQHVCSRVGGRGRHWARGCHGVADRARRRVRAMPDLQQRTLALRTATRSHRSRVPSHVRRPHARSKDAAVTVLWRCKLKGSNRRPLLNWRRSAQTTQSNAVTSSRPSLRPNAARGYFTSSTRRSRGRRPGVRRCSASPRNYVEHRGNGRGSGSCGQTRAHSPRQRSSPYARRNDATPG